MLSEEEIKALIGEYSKAASYGDEYSIGFIAALEEVLKCSQKMT